MRAGAFPVLHVSVTGDALAKRALGQARFGNLLAWRYSQNSPNLIITTFQQCSSIFIHYWIRISTIMKAHNWLVHSVFPSFRRCTQKALECADHKSECKKGSCSVQLASQRTATLAITNLCIPLRSHKLHR